MFGLLWRVRNVERKVDAMEQTPARAAALFRWLDSALETKDVYRMESPFPDKDDLSYQHWNRVRSTEEVRTILCGAGGVISRMDTRYEDAWGHRPEDPSRARARIYFPAPGYVQQWDFFAIERPETTDDTAEPEPCDPAISA